MKVVCQDARTFRLEDHESDAVNAVGFSRAPTANYFSDDRQSVVGADLITMSYSLSMIVSQKQPQGIVLANWSSRTSTPSSIHSLSFFHQAVTLESLTSTFSRSLI